MSIGVDSKLVLRPTDRLLTATRIAWLVVAVAVLVLLIPELAATFQAAQHVCHQPDCAGQQTPAQAAHTLRSAGISLATYAAYHIALVLIDVVVCYAVAAALMLRRSGDRMVLLTAFASVLICTPATLPLQEAGSMWTGPSYLLIALTTISGSLLLYVFPTASFVPRWTAVLAIGFIAFQFLPASSLPDLLNLVLFFGFFISIIALQVYRYRKLSNPIQQQQTKLVVFGIGILAGFLIVATTIWDSDAELQKQVVPALLLLSLGTLSPLVVIASIGLAVLRHGLWDIDVFINRTLIYLVLTASLGLVYLGSVVGLQTISGAITGRQSDLTIVISTLTIAALFNPLRRRIQDLIARTFYRRKYDAAKILAAFGTACRDETDLQVLQANLLRVVEETMQPGQVSLWLREDAVGSG